jgi:hypothetical protein
MPNKQEKVSCPRCADRIRRDPKRIAGTSHWLTVGACWLCNRGKVFDYVAAAYTLRFGIKHPDTRDLRRFLRQVRSAA